MTWNAFHSRGGILRTVIAAADPPRDGRLPLDVDGARGCSTTSSTCSARSSCGGTPGSPGASSAS